VLAPFSRVQTEPERSRSLGGRHDISCAWPDAQLVEDRLPRPIGRRPQDIRSRRRRNLRRAESPNCARCIRSATADQGSAHGGFTRFERHQGCIDAASMCGMRFYRAGRYSLGMVWARQLLGDRPAGHRPIVFRGAEDVAPLAGLDAVLRLVRGIGMGGAKAPRMSAVIAGRLILVAPAYGNRRSSVHPSSRAAEALDRCVLLAGRW